MQNMACIGRYFLQTQSYLARTELYQQAQVFKNYDSVHVLKEQPMPYYMRFHHVPSSFSRGLSLHPCLAQYASD